MPYPNLAVAVVMQRTRLDNRWQSEQWEPIGVLADSSEPGSAVRVLRQDGVSAQWLHPGFKLELFHDESEGYYLNLYSPRPYVFVNWLEEDGKGVPQSVTVSYNEAARQMDRGASSIRRRKNPRRNRLRLRQQRRRKVRRRCQRRNPSCRRSIRCGVSPPSTRISCALEWTRSCASPR